MNAAYLNILEQFSQPKVLVVGDIILDSYLKGDSTRLSPEAPVPVVNVSLQDEVVGGAANIAVNLCALGAKVTFLSAVGDDDGAERAIQLIKKAGIETHAIVKEAGRKTMVKTRVMCQSQILARFDYGSQKPVNSQTQETLIKYLKEHYSDFEIIMVGDYYSGILTPNLIKTLEQLQKKAPKFFAVDSKNLLSFKNVKPSLVKPNYYEALKILNLSHQESDRAEQLANYGEKLYEKTKAKNIALTLDADGALIFQEGKFSYRSLAHHVSSPNVVGAGDTFISAYTLALHTGADIPLATELATAAAAIAVQKEDTAPCYVEELTSFFSIHNKFVTHPIELKKLCEIYEAQGKRIVFTNGCFDILHSGHVSYLNRSKEMGDILIVGLNSDESIQRLKGKDRPINPLADRMQVLSGLSAIDHIVPFTEDTPIELIKAARPHIYAKGGDYTKETLPEAKIVEELGGEVVFVPLVPDHSTTLIIRRINSGNEYRLAQA
ncbi:D-glycero-beta-D-manno-heptose 1-phosphate adenylyltransferase [Rubrolithibacter danxiaensis]|uniref:D-glycero-beta-D-manno-heptose 1-phosphate adenylyltransferase n=1 Tax=Rubrolithibacter danxiaensis TaxID=3390805 RepID=UPI003BF918CE